MLFLFSNFYLPKKREKCHLNLIMSRNIRPIGDRGGRTDGGRQPPKVSGAAGANTNNSRRSQSVSKDLVTRAYNNNIIVKNEDGEYAPIGLIIFFN